MRRLDHQALLCVVITAAAFASVAGCSGERTSRGSQPAQDLARFEGKTGLDGDVIDYSAIAQGVGPEGFRARTGAAYVPSFNEDPAIPAQCWIETGYGTQNACKYCHTDYLAQKQHGNATPTAEDQILYSFPTPNLNHINWGNIIKPQEGIARLRHAGLTPYDAADVGNLRYVRQDNWRTAYRRARGNGDRTWDNRSSKDSDLRLLPALDPDNLYPYQPGDPTDEGRHGYIDPEGFVRDRDNGYTGWRAINFFPYAIFTPLTGSVSGIYIRLPRPFMTLRGKVNIEVLRKNLALLEQNIKDGKPRRGFYYGDAQGVPVQKGFYPVGTEFAHPLHYVDLNADGETGADLDGVMDEQNMDFEFPGTRSKRLKELRYLYKWKHVGLEDIAAEEEQRPVVIGKKWQGWIDNKAGWILAGYIEDRKGALRPQTTEELLQCLGCHSSVGTTVDSVWSLQRKLPGPRGWGEMDYGGYRAGSPDQTRLQDRLNASVGQGELEYFYATVVGSDLFGVMPREIKLELVDFARRHGLRSKAGLSFELAAIFDDEALKSVSKKRRKAILEARARIMREYAKARAYLYHDPETGKDYIKGNVFYPSMTTMKANIAAYRNIVLDQSFNHGKATFGTQEDAIPFTFRSDGTVRNGDGVRIPAGDVIESRPWNDQGVGVTPTGIVGVNDQGQPVDEDGNLVDLAEGPERAVGHVTRGGTFDTGYNPILSEEALSRPTPMAPQ